MRYFYTFHLVLVFILTGLSVNGQSVVINEIMSANSATITDNDGDNSDWIELYNAGNETVNLEGWSLSDDPDNLLKWVFPAVSLDPGEYLLVWASGKNKNLTAEDLINGFKREVYPQISGSSIQQLVTHPSYPDNPAISEVIIDKLEAPSNIGDYYGQRIHALIKAPVTGNYTFWIASDDNGQLLLSTNENPENLSQIATVPYWTGSREWDKYPEQKSAPVFLEKDKFYYIMALVKEEQGGDNLAVRWQLPDGTFDGPVSAKYLFWKEEDLHTNFSISSEGEKITLANAAGELIDELTTEDLPFDVSYGRKPDGSASFQYFTQPTPGEANSSSGYAELLKSPEFSHTGGFYSESFQLSLNSSQSGVTIVYSLDGSEPSTQNLVEKKYQFKQQFKQYSGSPDRPLLTRSYQSNIYSGPVNIYDRTGETNQVSGISSTFDAFPSYIPAYPVQKAIVVKAQAVKDGAIPSKTITHTYFVTEKGNDEFTLPVISFSAQEDYLFEYTKGIYTAGKDFEDWRASNPNSGANGGSPANYTRRGDNWEYLASFEYFEKSGEKVLGQNIGFRIHGGWSRSHPQKSLRIYARNQWGESHLNYPFFKNQQDDAFKRIVLRNSGNDYGYTLFRDAAMQAMIKHMDLEIQDYQPAILFLNGEYWGIQNIRERFDKHYIFRIFGVDEDELDILDSNMEVSEGDNIHYSQTIDYLNQNNLDNQENYAYIKTRVDVENYRDYMLSQIFFANTDWPGNNIKYWRLRTDEYLPDAGPGKDGRWRWMVFDTDFGFGLYGQSSVTTNMMNFATRSDGPGWPNPSWSTFLFRKLLENDEFRNDFIIRFCDQLNTAFLPEVVREIINGMKEGIEPEIDRHIERWEAPSGKSLWNNRINVMLNFADQRPEIMRSHLQNFFDLQEEYNLTVDVSGQNHGHVILNTIPIVKETQGVAENPYPWEGIYYENMSVRLEALPEHGYKFLRWEIDSENYFDSVFEIVPQSDLTVKAVFEEILQPETIVHYWNLNKTNALFTPTYTLLSADLYAQLPNGGTTEITYDKGEGFEGINSQFGDEAENHLRVNNPLGSVINFELPTTGFSEIKFSYETRRSGQGSGTQIIEYSINGTDYTEFQRFTVEDEDPVLIVADFKDLVSVSNNSSFKIRIKFEQGEGSTAGNNRFDNFTLMGIPEPGLNLPPVLVSVFPNLFSTEESENIVLPLNRYFEDPGGDNLVYSTGSSSPQVVEPQLQNDVLTLLIKKRGESLLTISANDGTNPPVELQFNVLVYPKAFPLASGNFAFTNWDLNSPEMNFPEHMLFLQSDKNDPDDNDPLEYAYFIPENEYADDDSDIVGFPYKTTKRTRLNGLNDGGISFINTGRGRDLGGALLALNTAGVSEIQAKWLAGTILQNSRRYGLKLQYRVGTEGKFSDVEGSDYQAESDGAMTSKGAFILPPHLMGKSYVQLLWRYHFLSQTSGPRAQLQLDDILVAAKPGKPTITFPLADSPLAEANSVEWTATKRAQNYELQIAENESFSNPELIAIDIPETSYLTNIFEPDNNYFIRVRAKNEMVNGNWSDPVNFNTTTTASLTPLVHENSMIMYPNPFNQSAKISVTLNKPEKVTIEVFDMAGKKVCSVFSGNSLAGENSFSLDGNQLTPGTYLLICRTETTLFRQNLVKQ